MSFNRNPNSKAYPETEVRSCREVLAALLKDESGQDLIEYALVAALIALGAVASIKTLGRSISTAFTTINTTLNSNV